MISDVIESSLYLSIGKLFENDHFLLKYDVHERTIAHRLAVYLEHRFAGFDVDCEYNNDLDSETGRKQVFYPNGPAGTGAYPDIIIHQRGFNGPDHNRLVIEIKKKSSAEDDINRDRDKLCSYTASDTRNHLSYERGALVILGVKDEAGRFSVEWYKDGGKVANS